MPSSVAPHLAHIACVVRDHDEALAFYIGKLGFTLVEDTDCISRRKLGDDPPARRAT